MKEGVRFTVSVFIALLVTGSATWAQSTADSSKIVRVLTFNIYHGATMDGNFDLDYIARVINGTDPDLVALQEVDFMTRRARGYDLATEFGWRLKMASVFGRAMEYDGGEYGEAVLSRTSFISTKNVPLPFTGSREPRTALEVVTVLPSGDTIVFIGTHLDHIADDTDRILQVREINKKFAGSRYPSILAGDLNAVPGSVPIGILEELWSTAYDGGVPAPTFPSNDPVRKIDYVMFRPAERWRVISSEVIQDSVASDHCAYLVVLELK